MTMEKADLSKGYWIQKREFWVTTYSKKLVCHFLSNFELSYLWVMRGYLFIFLSFQQPLLRSASVFGIVINRAKIPFW